MVLEGEAVGYLMLQLEKVVSVEEEGRGEEREEGGSLDRCLSAGRCGCLEEGGEEGEEEGGEEGGEEVGDWVLKPVTDSHNRDRRACIINYHKWW